MSTASSSSSSPAVRQAGPVRAHLPRRHGDRSVRLASRLQGSRGPRLPGGGERVHVGADRRAGGPAGRGLRRDQGAHPGDRPVRAGAQGRLVGVLAHRGGPAVRDLLPPPCARRRGQAAAAGGRQAAGGRGGPARRQRAGGRRWRSSGSARCPSAPDESLLAYSTDFSGDERYTLRIKDLATGRTLPDEIPDTFYGCAWSLDASVLFYVTVDEAWRPYRVWRHRVGTPASSDVIVYEETDERFWLSIDLSRDDKWVSHLRGKQADQRMVAARLRRARGRVHRGRAATAGRRVRRRGRREPAADRAQRRRRGELRARHRAAAWHR